MSLSQQKEPTQALAYWRCGTFLTKGVLLEEVPSQIFTMDSYSLGSGVVDTTGISAT